MRPAAGSARVSQQGRLSIDRAQEIAREMLKSRERLAICRLLGFEGAADFSRIDDRALTSRLAIALRSGAVVAGEAEGRKTLTCWVELGDGGGRALLSEQAVLPGYEPWPPDVSGRVEAVLDALLAQRVPRELVTTFLGSKGGRRRPEEGLASAQGLKAACLDAVRTGRLNILRAVRQGAETAPRAAGKSADGQKPLPRASAPSAAVDHWIEIVLVDEDGSPLTGEPYELTLPDGDLRSGTLDADGRARLTGLKQAGACKVAFPQIDAREWRVA